MFREHHYLPPYRTFRRNTRRAVLAMSWMRKLQPQLKCIKRDTSETNGNNLGNVLIINLLFKVRHD